MCSVQNIFGLIMVVGLKCILETEKVKQKYLLDTNALSSAPIKLPCSTLCCKLGVSPHGHGFVFVKHGSVNKDFRTEKLRTTWSLS